MKKIIITAIILVTVFTGYLFGNKIYDLNNREDSFDLVENFNDIDGLIGESEYILHAKAETSNKEFIYKDELFYLTEVKVKDTYRSPEAISEKSITILQNSFVNKDSLLEKNGEYILFLKKIDFADRDDIYRSIGLHKGRFKLIKSKDKNLDDNNLEFANINFYLDNPEKGKNTLTITTKVLKDQIEKNAYAPKHLEEPKSKEFDE